jgi:hypothetical protein
MKMHKIVGIFLILCFSASASYAAKGGEYGASEKAYEKASDRSIFNRMSDWFSGRGKPAGSGKGMHENRPGMGKNNMPEAGKGMEHKAGPPSGAGAPGGAGRGR